MKKMLFPLSNSKLTLTELQSFINEELSAGFSTDFQKETENNSQLKNVAIISPNEHDELMVFFKTFGFNIIKRSEEEDTSEIPTLLIIEGPSAIQSGSILLKKISVENQIHMPVLYFPSHNFIENIINLISYPDLNYIKDPFNLMIIIE